MSETRLFYCARPSYGGWVSFTAHLAKTTGLSLCRPGKRNERRQREFGYGVCYQNVADLSGTPALITAIDPSYYWALEQFPEGSWLVIHDPTELKAGLLPLLRRFRLVTIRQSVQALLEGQGLSARFLLHPFHAYPLPAAAAERTKTVCLSRIDFDKGIEMILEANKSLEADKRVVLYGAENRLCVYHKLGGMDYRPCYRGPFAKDWGVLGSILQDAAWVVDMSSIWRDGGGTQYTFLEAIYAGVALVLRQKWIEGGPGPFKHGENCVAVETAAELAEALNTCSPSSLAEAAKRILEPHLEIEWRKELDL